MNHSIQSFFEYYQNYESLIDSAAEHIQKILQKHKLETPSFGLTLGSGLGDLANEIKNKIEIPYSEIPNFPTTTVAGHEGTLILGTLAKTPVIGLKGRKHFYESAHEPFNNGILKSVFAVHVLANLGVKNYFVTNAAGGLNPDYQVGDIMILKSHINLIPNPLLGSTFDFKRVSDGSQSWRFQPMNAAYDPKLTQLLKKATKSNKKHVHEGVYLAVTGPTYETEGECLAFRDGLGADAVGMSTTPEVIVARNRDMNVVGFSCITNTITPEGVNATNHEEVKEILESSTVKHRLNSAVLNFFSLIN